MLNKKICFLIMLCISMLILCSCTSEVIIPPQKIRVIDYVTKEPVKDAIVDLEIMGMEYLKFDNGFVAFENIYSLTDTDGIANFDTYIFIDKKMVRKYTKSFATAIHPFYFTEATGPLNIYADSTTIAIKPMETILEETDAEKAADRFNFSIIKTSGFEYIQNRKKIQKKFDTIEIRKKYIDFFENNLKKNFNISESWIEYINYNIDKLNTI